MVLLSIVYCPFVVPTVRKSLQGLDYFAAEGGKVFDDVAGVVDRLSVHEADSNWVSYCKIVLKNGKSHIKSDYEVCFVNRIESNLIHIHHIHISSRRKPLW